MSAGTERRLDRATKKERKPKMHQQNPLRFDLPGDVHVAGPPHRSFNPGQPRQLAPHSPCLHLQPRGIPAHLPGTLPVRFGEGRTGLLCDPVGVGCSVRGCHPLRSYRRRTRGRHHQPLRAADRGLASLWWLVVLVLVLVATCMYEVRSCSLSARLVAYVREGVSRAL